ncbi:MAG TPA: aldehyde dehydrogenase family protein [Polyangia bacterium]|nr:aldehyde dehydrogenase family protein [Polyangia bacterium]
MKEFTRTSLARLGTLLLAITSAGCSGPGASSLGDGGAATLANDLPRARALAKRIDTGSVLINAVLMNYFCVEAPLGGVKGSGIGFRHGPEGLRQFCRLETVVEDHPLLGWLSPFIDRQLSFPYRARTQRLLRWFMRRFY